MLNTWINFRQICLRLIAVLLWCSILSPAAFAQNRVDLDDLNIKGELLNDNRLRMSARDPHQPIDRVSYRNNFRKEVTDGLEISWPVAGDRAPASIKKAGERK